MAFTPNEKRVVTVTGAAHFLTHLYELTFPAIALTVRDDLGWSLAEVLRLSFLMYLLFGLGALPMGLWTDRWRARGVLSVCMLGAGVGALLVSVSRTPTQFVAALGLVGLGISGYHPAGMSLLSRTMRERGRALGWNGVFGNLGSATAPFIAGILAFQLGWRAAYAFLGVLGVVAGILGFVLPIDERSVSSRGARADESHGSRTRLGYFAIVCVAMMFGGFAYRGVSLVVPATFQQNTTFLTTLLQRLDTESLRGVANLAATVIASAVYSVGILGQILGGHLADRYDLRKLYLGFHAASLPFVAIMAFVGEWALVLAAAAYVFFGLGMQPIENSLVARFTPERWRSTSYGIKFVLNFGIGAFAVYGVSALHRDGSFTAVYVAVAAVVFLVCAASAALLYRSRGVPVLNEAAIEPLS